MSVRPILFSTPMTRALLDGRKTQTRRVLKPQPAISTPETSAIHVGGDIWRIGILAHAGVGDDWRAPYAPGDLLWVRETWAEHHPAGVQASRFSIDGRAGIPGPPKVMYRVIYRADGDPLRVWYCSDFPFRTTAGPRDAIDARYPEVCSEFPGWTPSIHMPRWASRLTLEVTDVRVERVRDISEADAIAEGIARSPHGNRDQWLDYPAGSSAAGWTDPRDSFRSLWDSINAKRGFGWDTNPWVSATTYTVHHQNVDELLRQREAA